MGRLRGVEVEMSQFGGGTPVEEPGADGEASGEDSAEVGRKGEVELGFGSRDVGFGQAGVDLDAGVAEVGHSLAREMRRRGACSGRSQRKGWRPLGQERGGGQLRGPGLGR